MSFSLSGFLVSIAILVIGFWSYGKEQKFISFLAPAEKMWISLLVWLLNICFLFFSVVFTFKLYVVPKMLALTLSFFIVFLIVLITYLVVRWRATLRLFKGEAMSGVEALQIELRKIAESKTGKGEKKGETN